CDADARAHARRTARAEAAPAPTATAPPTAAPARESCETPATSGRAAPRAAPVPGECALAARAALLLAAQTRRRPSRARHRAQGRASAADPSAALRAARAP